MSSYNIKGTIHQVGATEQVTERFSKRAFIITFSDNPKYPQFAKLEATGDKCSMLDGFSVGDEVSVEFNVRGRTYTNKKTGEEDCFTSLTAWKIDPVGERQERKQETRKDEAAGGGGYGGTGDDSIPFATADMAHEPSSIARVIR